MKKAYHISPSTTIIRRGNAPDEVLEFQPSGWPIWPSDDPTADAQKRTKVLCAWLPVAAKELKFLLNTRSLWRFKQNHQLALQYITNMTGALEEVRKSLSIIQKGSKKDHTNP